MCVAIPMRITSVAGTLATIETGGLTQRASLVLVPDAQVGDYVLVHAGYALTVLDEQDAKERMQLFAEMDELSAGEDDAPED